LHFHYSEEPKGQKASSSPKGLLQKSNVLTGTLDELTGSELTTTVTGMTQYQHV
jgi:hypothetical protein